MAARSAEILKDASEFVTSSHHHQAHPHHHPHYHHTHLHHPHSHHHLHHHHHHRTGFTSFDRSFDKRRPFDIKSSSGYRRPMPNTMHHFAGPSCAPHLSYATANTALHHPHTMSLPFPLPYRRRFYKSESAETAIARESKKHLKHLLNEQKVGVTFEFEIVRLSELSH